MNIANNSYTIAGFAALAAGILIYAGSMGTWSVEASGIAEVVSSFSAQPLFDSVMFWTSFASLFAIMNPVVAVPFFVSITEASSERERRQTTGIASFTVLAAMVVAALFGKSVLAFFAIDPSSFRIAGGFAVLLMELSMLRGETLPGAGTNAADTGGRAHAICPVAFPLIAGPGGIVTIILMSESADRFSDNVTIGAVIVAMFIVTHVILRLAMPVARFLGNQGLLVVTRLLGMIVSAIAIDMAVIGIRHHFPGLI
jgi:multiple antibiotic resistance protein